VNTAQAPDISIVVPTIGRPSLATLLHALDGDLGPLPAQVVLVDDRKVRSTSLPIPELRRLGPTLRVVSGRAAGPAAARNTGWRFAGSAWIAFLDDDVVPDPGWLADLVVDVAAARAAGEAGTAGRIRVPLPAGRKPTDWERNTAGLQHARWATADLAYARDALVEVAGFDERFRRAYREDADLALRLREAGHRLGVGARWVEHPVRPAGRWVSLGMQRGNADDALMRVLHGRAWRASAEVFRGRRNRHLAITTVALAGAAAATAGKKVPALAAGVAWAVGTAEFAWARISPGPKSPGEIAVMLLTSAAIPPLASWHWMRGLVRARHARAWPDRPAAVLLDRDGTLVHDVPYNGDPALVLATTGAREALESLRTRGIPIGVVTNQSGLARGRLSPAEVSAVNARVAELLGPIGVFRICPHGPDDGCDCRKPAPGLVLQAAAALGAHPRHCVVIGDIGADVEAAERAGARGILVPTPRTRQAEIAGCRHVVADLNGAVRLALDPEFLAAAR
jgi:HAD superfamily hydrolase (TIGR01662 family)